FVGLPIYVGLAVPNGQDLSPHTFVQVALGVFFALAAVFVGICCRRFRLPGLLTQALAEFGRPDEVLDQIDTELGAGRPSKQFGRLHQFGTTGAAGCAILTESWLLYLAPDDCQVVRVSEVTGVRLRDRVRLTTELREFIQGELCIRLRSGREVGVQLSKSD